MNVFTIPKKNGKMRTIYAPSWEEKAQMRLLLPALEEELSRAHGSSVQHGFRAGRSPVTNARMHIGKAYVLCFDLLDFFDHVRAENIFAPCLAGRDAVCFVDGIARQGLPTSPALANIAALRIDRDILALDRPDTRFGRLFAYTRYADDLTFSFDLPHIGEMLMREIPALCERHGFPVNPDKTHLQCLRNGRANVTGVAVDEHGIHTPRSVKRRLRAARHQLATGKLGKRTMPKLIGRQAELKRNGREVSLRAILRGQYEGLSEWARLKPPKEFRAQSPGARRHSEPVRSGNAAHRFVAQQPGAGRIFELDL